MWSLGKQAVSPAGDLGASPVASPTPQTCSPHTQGGEQVVWAGKATLAITPLSLQGPAPQHLGAGPGLASSDPGWQDQACSVDNTGKVPHPPHQGLNKFTMVVMIPWGSPVPCELKQWAIGGGGDWLPCLGFHFALGFARSVASPE